MKMIRVIFSFMDIVVMLIACDSSAAMRHEKNIRAKNMLAKTMQQLIYEYNVPGAVLSYGKVVHQFYSRIGAINYVANTHY
jgi:hypothetical protein